MKQAITNKAIDRTIEISGMIALSGLMIVVPVLLTLIFIGLETMK